MSADPLLSTFASRSHRRGPFNGLQDQSAFLRITSWSPSIRVVPWLVARPAANSAYAPLRRYLLIGRLYCA
jgi:hypothetical protein